MGIITRTLFQLRPIMIAQEEINNRSDILPGYHIQDTIEVGIGLSNLVKHTVSPPCHPVVAVMGLVCSSHTSILSPVAGHKGFDLIQLSRASSPIFETQYEHFPHLWRNIGAATVYSDTVLAIMDHFNWTRVGIVYNTDSSFYSCRACYGHRTKNQRIWQQVGSIQLGNKRNSSII